MQTSIVLAIQLWSSFALLGRNPRPHRLFRTAPLELRRAWTRITRRSAPRRSSSSSVTTPRASSRSCATILVKWLCYVEL